MWKEFVIDQDYCKFSESMKQKKTKFDIV